MKTRLINELHVGPGKTTKVVIINRRFAAFLKFSLQSEGKGSWHN